ATGAKPDPPLPRRGVARYGLGNRGHRDRVHSRRGARPGRHAQGLPRDGRGAGAGGAPPAPRRDPVSRPADGGRMAAPSWSAAARGRAARRGVAELRGGQRAGRGALRVRGAAGRGGSGGGADCRRNRGPGSPWRRWGANAVMTLRDISVEKKRRIRELHRLNPWWNLKVL